MDCVGGGVHSVREEDEAVRRRERVGCEERMWSGWEEKDEDDEGACNVTPKIPEYSRESEIPTERCVMEPREVVPKI